MNTKHILFILTIFFVTHHNVNAGICHSLLKKQLAYKDLEQDEESYQPQVEIHSMTTLPEEPQKILPRPSKSSFAKASADKKKTKAGLHQKLTQRQLTGRCPFKSMKADHFAQIPCFQEEIQRDIARIDECDEKHPEIYWKWMKELPLEYQHAIKAAYPISLPKIIVFSKDELMTALSSNTPVCISSLNEFSKQEILSTLTELPLYKKELIWGLHVINMNLNNQELKDILTELSTEMLQTLLIDHNQISDISIFLPYKQLKYLGLSNNHISEIMGLATLTNLVFLLFFPNDEALYSQKEHKKKILRFLRTRTCKKPIMVDHFTYQRE